MTEETIERTTGKTERVYQAARSSYDLLHGFATNRPVQLVITMVALIVINLLLGEPLFIVAVLMGFFIAAPFVWLIFPNAAWSWILRTDLDKRIVSPEKVVVTEGSRLLDNVNAQQLFRSNDGKTCIVYGQSQGISEVHTLSDLHYLNDITVLAKAILLFKPLVIEVTELRTYRGLEVATLAAEADNQRAKAKDPLSSSLLGELYGKREDITDTSETPEQENADTL